MQVSLSKSILPLDAAPSRPLTLSTGVNLSIEDLLAKMKLEPSKPKASSVEVSFAKRGVKRKRPEGGFSYDVSDSEDEGAGSINGNEGISNSKNEGAGSINSNNGVADMDEG